MILNSEHIGTLFEIQQLQPVFSKEEYNNFVLNKKMIKNYYELHKGEVLMFVGFFASFSFVLKNKTIAPYFLWEKQKVVPICFEQDYPDTPIVLSDEHIVQL